ncbi:MAG: hypothetical protein AAF280_14820 [Pseudomonadota bacterium]
MSVGNGSSPVVIYVNGGPPQEVAPSRERAAAPPIQNHGHNVIDPYELAKSFPELWAAHIRANYRSPLHVQREFHVSERTAYRWWNGQGGAHGAHVAIAVANNPDTAPRDLFPGSRIAAE